MSEYGVTKTGFIRKRLPEIEKEIQQDLKSKLIEQGYTGELSVEENSVIGLLIKTFAERETAMWEIAHGIYTATYPSTASGIALDNAASFTGVSRLGSTKAKGTVTFYGQVNTTIPNLTEIKNTKTNTVWQTVDDAKIELSHINEVEIYINGEPKNKTKYSFTVDSKEYSYTTPDIASRLEIINKISTQIDKSEFDLISNDDSLIIRKRDHGLFHITNIKEFQMKNIGIDIEVQALSNERDSADIGELNQLNSNIEGIDKVINHQETMPFKDIETDADLRERYQTGVFRTGASTLPSLRPNLLNNVANVIDCVVFENSTDNVDDKGRPPHSVHYVVFGGSDTDIAEEIHKRKSAGIDTHGKVTVNLSKEYGEFKVHFDRPTLKYVWLKLKVTTKNSLTTVRKESVIEEVLKQASGYQIGESIPSNSLVCSLYTDTNIKNIDIEFSVTTKENQAPVKWLSGLIEIDEVDLLMFDSSRISVEVI